MPILFLNGTVDTATTILRVDTNTINFTDQPLCAFPGCTFPRVNLGADRQGCGPVRLVADSLFAGQQVVWSTGRIGQGRDTLIAPGPGRYAVNVTGVCGDFRDTITITAGPAQPIRIAPRPLASCPGGELAFGVQSPGGQAVQLTWRVNGRPAPATGDSLYLTPTNPTNRDSTLTIIAQAGGGACLAADTLHVTLWPGYPHFLGPDIAACTPDTFLAAPGFAVGQGLVWRTPTATSTEAVIRVRQTGVYSATFTSRGCVYKDSITVSGGAQAVGIALRVNGALLAPGQDTATASLPVRVVASPERSVRGPIWQGGIAADSLAITATRDTAITISLSYADSAGCPGIAQRVLHLRIALTDFVLPNLVTANGDEVNEYLTSKTPLPPGAMRIYDRWGRLAYEQNLYNGRWPDAGVRVGTYFYLFTTAAGKRYTGWVEVVR